MYKKKKGLPQIATSSLPDIVFMLLFFFMVATIMRTEDPQLKINLPSADQVQKLKDRSLVSYIYIGTPIDTAKSGREPRIQLNDQYRELEDIIPFIKRKIDLTPDFKRNALITALKVDAETKMWIVTDVKQELRKAKSYKINYNTKGSRAND